MSSIPATARTAWAGVQPDATDGIRLLPEWLLYLFIFSMPWEDQFVVGSFGTLSRVAGALAFGAGIVATLSRARFRRPHAIHVGLVLFLLWGSLTWFWSLFPDDTYYGLKTFLQLMAMVWMIHEFAPDQLRQQRVMKAYVLGSLVSSMDTIAAFFSHRAGRFYQRHVAEGFDPNDLCIILAISMALSWYLAAREPAGLMSWVWRLQPAAVLFAGSLTASRSGSIALAIALLMVPAGLSRMGTRQKLWLAAAGAAAIAAILTWTPITALDRVSTMLTDTNPGTLGERVPIWRAGWEVFTQHPFAGAGLYTYAAAIRPIYGFGVVGHHVFLTVLTELGLIGFVMFLGVCTLCLRAIVHMSVLERRLWLILVAVWLCAALSLSWLHRKPTWFLFGLLASQAATLSAGRRGGLRE
jgi:O-antigen ligase